MNKIVKIIVPAVLVIIVTMNYANFSYVDNGKNVEKEKHLIIVNNKDSIITDAKSYFESIEVDNIMSIKTINDEKVLKETGIDSIISIIKVEMKDSVKTFKKAD